MDAFFDFEKSNVETTVESAVTTESGEAIPTGTPAHATALEVAAKEKEYAALQESIKPQEDEIKALEAEVQSIRELMQAQINERTQKIAAMKEAIWDARKQLKQLALEIDGLKRRLRVEMDAERAKETFKSNVIVYDKRMANRAYADKILSHQSEGAYILASNGRCILGDKRGLGKTLTSLATLDALQIQRALIIVPDDVFGNFANEINYWAPHRQILPVGKMTKVQREFAFTIAQQVDQWTMLINYSAWRKDKSILDSIISLGVECVIADEAHEMKNTSTSAYKGVRKIVLAENMCPKCGGIQTFKQVKVEDSIYYSHMTTQCTKCDFDSDVDEYEFLDRCSVKYVFPMTGTVILNKPQDLFAQLSLIDPVNFRYERDFLNAYCEQSWATGKWSFQYGGMDRLAKKLSGKYLARDEHTAGVVRPKQSVEVHEIEMDETLYPLQYKVMQQLSKHAAILLDSGKKMNVLATIALITRKRQANIWPAGITLKDENGDVVFSVGEEVQESIKLDFILRTTGEDAPTGLLWDLTEEGNMELGSNVVVFSQFKGPLAELEKRCKAVGISVVRFDGDTPQSIRDEAIKDFDRKFREAEGYEPKWQVILANYRTGGVGLNFTAATEMIITDEEWNPGKADQAFGRIDRMGQTEETNVHILRIPRTIDDWMVALNQEKADLIAGFESKTEGISDALLLAMRNGDII